MTAFIGVLMLDTRFERIRGDAGNPESYHLPARTRVVRNADSTLIVRNGRPEPALLDAFCDAARALEAEGAVALTSTCGFLITAQQEIAGSVRIPVMLSALTLFPVIRVIHGERPVGILTASSEQLGSAILDAASIQPGQAVVSGLQDEEAFSSCFLAPRIQQRTSINQRAITSAVIQKATALCDATPQLSAILLECGNLPPYARAIMAATGKPVYSILDGARILTR